MLRRVLIFVAVTVLVASQTHGDLLQNGSFEVGVDPGVGPMGLPNGSTSIESWVVNGDMIDYVGSSWQASDGTRSIDLDGNHQRGGISQAFATTPGTRYLVTFDIAGNCGGPPPVKAMRVRVDNVGGDFGDFTFDTTGHGQQNMGWAGRSWEFTASESQTTIEFLSMNTVNPDYGPALDNVRVNEVPDPTGLGMVGVVGLALLRRRDIG